MVDCLRVVFVSRGSNRVVALSMGKVKKGDVLRHVKAHFAWQAWVAIKRKVFRDSLMFTSRCLWRKCEKRECVVTCESAL